MRTISLFSLLILLSLLLLVNSSPSVDVSVSVWSSVNRLSEYKGHPLIPHTTDDATQIDEAITDPLFDFAHKVIDYAKEFGRFMKDFAKKYSGTELRKRFELFKQNSEIIFKHNNNPNKTYRLAVNSMSDLSPDEFRNSKLGVALPLDKQQIKKLLQETQIKVPDYVTKTLLNEAEIDEAVQIESNESETELDDAQVASLPAAVDWRKNLNPIQDQGLCGSCWAFATTAAIEGSYAIKHAKLYKASEQQLLDCTSENTDTGLFGIRDGKAFFWSNRQCTGGLSPLAMAWLLGLTGTGAPKREFTTLEDSGNVFKPNPAAVPRQIISAKAYSYANYNGLRAQRACSSSRYQNSVLPIKLIDVEAVPQNNVQRLMAAVAKGPVSISISGENTAFRNYYDGVIDGSDSCGGSSAKLDHQIVIVGYGTSTSRWTKKSYDYWLVRNSWGTRWGEKGYARVQRGKNVCGIENYGYRPIVA